MLGQMNSFKEKIFRRKINNYKNNNERKTSLMAKRLSAQFP
jgi:hypothetical protein